MSYVNLVSVAPVSPLDHLHTPQYRTMLRKPPTEITFTTEDIKYFENLQSNLSAETQARKKPVDASEAAMQRRKGMSIQERLGVRK